jgi:hypothetical protein
MSHASDRQQAKRDFLNAAKVIFADGKFSDWMPVMIFSSIPVAFGINLYIIIDSCFINIILPILLSPLSQLVRINDLGSWVIGLVKIGVIFVDILAFVTISCILFLLSRVIRKIV